MGPKNKQVAKKQNGKSNYTDKAEKSKKRKEKRQAAIQNFAKFEVQLKKLDMRIKEVSGDGNCLFRSICDQFEGNEANHEHYRNLACEYIEENSDFLKFFMEDDKPIDKYLQEMRKDGTWGGNIELYSLSMLLKVNFYIHLYNRPMYIVKNHEYPSRDVFLSYHDGEHYNSVRLITDTSVDEPPVEIPLSLLMGVSQTQDAGIINDDDDNNEDIQEFEDYEEEDKTDINSKTNKDNGSFSGGIFKGINIGDINNKPKEAIKKVKQKVLSKEGILYDVPKKKCYCGKGKSYKNCHEERDIKGEYYEGANTFYCDIPLFNQIIDNVIKENKHSSAQDNIGELSNNFGMIFI